MKKVQTKQQQQQYTLEPWDGSFEETKRERKELAIKHGYNNVKTSNQNTILISRSR